MHKRARVHNNVKIEDLLLEKTYFRLTSFILLIVFLKTISTGFVDITENKVSLFFVLEKKLVPKIRLFLCFGLHKVIV